MTAPTQQQPRPPADGIDAAQLAELIVLVKAQAAVRRQLTRTAVAAVRAAFAGFEAWWWDTARVNRAIASALRVIQSAQRQAARTTDAYLARAATAMTGRPARPAGLVDVTRLRRSIPPDVARQLIDGALKPAWVELGSTHDGPAKTIDAAANMALPAGRPAVAPADPYGRVIDQYRYDIVAKATPEPKAREKAQVRLAIAAETDVTLAVREQVRRSLDGIDGVTGYRRILHPEMSETGPCGLCVVAADRIYKRGDLKPIHDRCRCEVLPIIGARDPGLDLNRNDLAKLYEAAGSTGGAKQHRGALKRIRVALAEHGELGPILVDADREFRGPAQVARIMGPDPEVSKRAQIAALEDQLDKLRRGAHAGQDMRPAIEWHTRRIEQLRRELGVLV